MNQPLAIGRGYDRALLKISGEALAGEQGFGLAPDRISWIAEQIGRCSRQGAKLGVVVGAGNILRGATAASLDIPALRADHMGMIATVINALALQAALEKIQVQARAMSAFPVGNFIEQFEGEAALNYVNKGTVVIFAGGTGNPCFTTDSAAALRAVQIEADVVVKGTQVPGVFDKDPRKFTDAVFFESISFQEVLERRLGVIDATSVEILSRKNIPIVVCDLHGDGNLAGVLAGEKIGTVIH